MIFRRGGRRRRSWGIDSGFPLRDEVVGGGMTEGGKGGCGGEKGVGVGKKGAGKMAMSVSKGMDA